MIYIYIYVIYMYIYIYYISYIALKKYHICMYIINVE